MTTVDIYYILYYNSLMTKMTAGKASVILLTAMAASTLMGYSLTSVLAVSVDARAYCHANSGASGYNYLNNPAWTQHFENNGTPKSGHELDFFALEGDTDCDGEVDTPTPTVTPIPTTVPSPTVIPTPVPSDTPTETPNDPTLTPTPVEDISATPTPTVAQVLGDSNDVCTNLDGIQTSVPNGWFQNGAGSTECRQFQFGGAPEGENSPQGQVLGASTEAHVLGANTLAATGSTAETLMMLGLILSGASMYGLVTPVSVKVKKAK